MVEGAQIEGKFDMFLGGRSLKVEDAVSALMMLTPYVRCLAHVLLNWASNSLHQLDAMPTTWPESLETEEVLPGRWLCCCYRSG